MKKSCIWLVLALLYTAPSPAYAHAGHDDLSALTGGDAAPSSTPLTLSAETVTNLDIKTAPAELKPLPDSISMSAIVQLPPEKRALITTRFDGRVTDIKVKQGQDVEKGQDLITIEPMAYGGQPVTFKSPLRGKVIGQNAVLGQPISFETTLMEVADTSTVLLQGSLYEVPELAKIKPGQTARAQIGIYPDRIFEGIVEKIDVGPATDSRAMHVYASFDNTDGALKPNLRGNLSVYLGGVEKPTIVIPASAVLENNGTLFVFVQEGSSFERRNVQIGKKSAGSVEIIEGVLPGEQVVIQGNYQLQYLKPQAPAQSKGD